MGTQSLESTLQTTVSDKSFPTVHAQVKVRAEARSVGMGAARRAARARQTEAALAAERKALVTQLPSLASAYEAAAPIAQRLTATKGASMHEMCKALTTQALV